MSADLIKNLTAERDQLQGKLARLHEAVKYGQVKGKKITHSQLELLGNQGVAMETLVYVLDERIVDLKYEEELAEKEKAARQAEHEREKAAIHKAATESWTAAPWFEKPTGRKFALVFAVGVTMGAVVASAVTNFAWLHAA